MTAKHNHKQWKKLSADESHWCSDKQELTIDLSKLLGKPASLILTSWKHGIVWSNVIDGEVELHKNPFEQSLFPIGFISHDLLKPWRATIPEAVIKRLRIYGGNAFGMLNICSCFQSADELFANNPILFWLLFTYAQQHNWHEFEFVKTCRLKQTEILKAINLPATKSTLKLLHKIKARQFAQQEYELIRELLTLDVHGLNHRTTISLPLIKLIIHFPLLLNSKLLNHWNGKGIKLLSELVQDIEHMTHRMGLDRGAINQQLFSCRGIECVQRIHDKLVVQLNNKMIAITTRNQEHPKQSEALLIQPFPIPPLLGNKHIIPITNTNMLLEESKLQHHCVAAYDEEIIQGDYYVYQILAPERATLGIKVKRRLLQQKGEQPNLKIDQLKGYRNKAVSRETKEAVMLWFNDKNNINQKIPASLRQNAISTIAEQQCLHDVGSK